MNFLAPLFFVGLLGIAVPVLVHLIQRERRNIVPFPSLMFVRRIPYQSVERRRIHNWPLLLLRAAAIALLVAAFARPFFTQAAVAAATEITGAREVVLLLDRSASMGYGDHWARAQEEALNVLDRLDNQDQVTLVLFAAGAEERVRATPVKSAIAAAIRDASVTSFGTRFGPALRLAQSVLTRSTLPEKEVVLVSDFQRNGWERQEEIRLPEGAVLTPISVAEPDATSLSVTSVSFDRETFSGQERVTITAGIANRSGAALTGVPVSLELDGRTINTQSVDIGERASASVTFPQQTIAQPNIRGTVRAGDDPLPADNAFHFTLSPTRPVSVLVIEGEGGSREASLFLSTALAVNATPPFRVDVQRVPQVSPASFEGRSVVVLNDATSLSSVADQSLRRFVEQGGGLLIGLGANTPWGGGGGPLLPGSLGSAVTRDLRGGSLGFLDTSHPVLEPFKDPRNGTFTDVQIFRYRQVTPAETDRVLARYDDGAAALIERQVGSGRVVAWTSTLDSRWNTFPQRPMYPIVMPALLRYLAQFEQPDAWYTVGRMLDITAPVAAIVREGEAGDTESARRATGVVLSPSGRQVTLGEGGAPSIELAEQGFYSVRMQGLGGDRPFAAAVNLDPAESDLTPVVPAEMVAAVTGVSTGEAVLGATLERPALTPADMERRQSIWWLLLVAGLGLLLVEAFVANRQSRRMRRRPQAVEV